MKVDGLKVQSAQGRVRFIESVKCLLPAKISSEPSISCLCVLLKYKKETRCSSKVTKLLIYESDFTNQSK